MDSEKISNHKGAFHGQIVVPGKILGIEEDYIAGLGVYASGGYVRSSLLGRCVIETDYNDSTNNAGYHSKRRRINVISTRPSVIDSIISIGDEVICQVTRVMLNQINVELIAIGDRELKQMSRGILRKEDVTLTEVDKVVLSHFFCPGDIMKAVVTSLGDSKHYYLSCASENQGVIIAKHQYSGRFMVAVNTMEMEDPVTKERETRKVAKLS